MRVLLLTPEYPPIGGGAANACFYLVQEVRQLGVEVDVLTSSPSQSLEREASPGGDLLRVPVGKKAVHYWTYPEALRYIYRASSLSRGLYRERGYTVSHAFFTIPSALVAFLHRRQAPYIVSIRGSDVPGFNRRFTGAHSLLRPLTRMLWRNAAFVVSNSQGLRKLAQRTMPSLDMPVIPNGVDTREFSPAPVRPPRDDARVRLLAVNRLIQRKGTDTLLQALAQVRRHLGDVFHLHLVGEGNLEAPLRALAHRLGIADAVTFAGSIPHEALPDFYRQADVFLLPSHAEGMSNALLEAMASGLPVIVTDTGGSAELVQDNGLVIPPGNPPALEAALAQMLTNPGLRREMGMRSRLRAAEWDWRSVAQQYICLYQQTSKGAGIVMAGGRG